MAIPNPIYGLVLPFLWIFTLPLAILAGVTTTIAFSILMFRVVLVYLDIALSLVPQYLMGRSTPAGSSLPPPSYHFQDRTPSPKSPTSSEGAGPVSGTSTPPRPATLPLGFITTGRTSTIPSPTTGRRSRRPSTVGATRPNTPGESTTPFAFPSTTSSSGTGIARDFEGVGGWRLGPDADDESDWANINSRLELPLERSRPSSSHHYRTSTGGSTPGDGIWLTMKSPTTFKRKMSPERDSSVAGAGSRSGRTSVSPNSSRHRVGHPGTVHFTGIDEDERRGGYFGLVASPDEVRKGV